MAVLFSVLAPPSSLAFALQGGEKPQPLAQVPNGCDRSVGGQNRVVVHRNPQNELAHRIKIADQRLRVVENRIREVFGNQGPLRRPSMQS